MTLAIHSNIVDSSRHAEPRHLAADTGSRRVLFPHRLFGRDYHLRADLHGSNAASGRFDILHPVGLSDIQNVRTKRMAGFLRKPISQNLSGLFCGHNSVGAFVRNICSRIHAVRCAKPVVPQFSATGHKRDNYQRRALDHQNRSHVLRNRSGDRVGSATYKPCSAHAGYHRNVAGVQLSRAATDSAAVAGAIVVVRNWWIAALCRGESVRQIANRYILRALHCSFPRDASSFDRSGIFPSLGAHRIMCGGVDPLASGGTAKPKANRYSLNLRTALKTGAVR
jgi:hypothetical protein